MTIRAVRFATNKPAASQIGFLSDIVMEAACSFPNCSAVYRLDYTPNEDSINVVELLPKMTGKVNRSHPEHHDAIVLRQ